MSTLAASSEVIRATPKRELAYACLEWDNYYDLHVEGNVSSNPGPVGK